MKKKIVVSCGTRPEIIKMAPILFAFKKYKSLFDVLLLDTGQHFHSELSSQLYDWFKIKPDNYLNYQAKKNTDLGYMTSKLIALSNKFIKDNQPDLILVQGDTNSAFVLAYTAYVNKIPVGHIEAGLRTDDFYLPFPEEINRRLISKLTTLQFPPTKIALANLKNENINNCYNYYGNTVIDSLQWTLKRKHNISDPLKSNKNLILMTCHRRENWGQPFIDFIKVIDEFLLEHNNFQVLLPLHPNPILISSYKKADIQSVNFNISKPLSYPQIAAMLDKAILLLTDSGGIQEEAAYLGKRTFILRKKTERIEALKENWIECIGSDASKLKNYLYKFANNSKNFTEKYPSKAFGDGNASKKIVEEIVKYYKV